MTSAAGADALIVRDGAILLGHRMDHDPWVFQGGAAEPWESPWDAAVRETFEEVGLQASVARLLGVTWQPGLAAPPANLFRPQRERLAADVGNGWSDVGRLSTQVR